MSLRDYLEGKKKRPSLPKIPRIRGRGFDAFTHPTNIPSERLPDDSVGLLDSIIGEQPKEFKKLCKAILPPDEAREIIQQMILCCPAQQEVLSVLQANGFEPARSTKHNVWVSKQLKATWTTPKTPGDIRSWKNNLSDLQMKLRYQYNRYETPATKISPDEVITAEEALKAHNQRKKNRK